MGKTNLDLNDLGNLTRTVGSKLSRLIGSKKPTASFQFQDKSEKADSNLNTANVFSLLKEYLPKAKPLDLSDISLETKEHGRLLNQILNASEQCKSSHGLTIEELIEKAEIPIIPFYADDEFQSCFFANPPNYALVINARLPNTGTHFSLHLEIANYIFNNTINLSKDSKSKKQSKKSQIDAERAEFIATKFAEFFVFDLNKLEKVALSISSDFDETLANELIESAQVSPEVLKNAICDLLEIRNGKQPDEDLVQKLDRTLSQIESINTARVEELIRKSRDQFREMMQSHNRKFSEENFNLINNSLKLGFPRF